MAPKKTKYDHLIDRLKAKAQKEEEQKKRQEDLERHATKYRKIAKNRWRRLGKPFWDRQKYETLRQERQLFWARIDVITIDKDKNGSTATHRFQVKGHPMQYRHFIYKDDYGIAADTVIEYRFFLVKASLGKWRIYDELTGTLLATEANPIEARNVAMRLLTNKNQDMIQRLVQQPALETLPVLHSQQAVAILDGRIQEKRMKRELRRIEKEARIQKINSTSDRYTQRE